MLRTEDLERITPALPFLTRAPGELIRDFLYEANIHTIPAGTQVFAEGDACDALAILLSGTVRVFKIGETGREITLYRFDRGESCILTANCILGNRHFPAIAVVEHDAEAIVITAAAFRNWFNRYQLWRDYVFDLLSRRLASVMAVVDEVAFRRMDTRIADFLARRLNPSHPTLRITHQEIAAELGTSREVVSRILEDFSAARLIETGRGTIRLLDHAGLLRRTKA
ncbi:MAG: Crp/Fnr family transcriptional regulator [Thermoflexales bacterium]|nr:Crp/Fnr family transcriptional regulator [Thermoflexales bacterium]MDW8350427.1 Crp/Fnr family transcriptional regulator [Anaerolineae bacterium]